MRLLLSSHLLFFIYPAVFVGYSYYFVFGPARLSLFDVTHDYGLTLCVDFGLSVLGYLWIENLSE
jgi:hypothetical protein